MNREPLPTRSRLSVVMGLGVVGGCCGMNDPTPYIYSGRVGHDASEGFCSCGGYHYVEDGVKVGTKTVAVLVDGRVRNVEYGKQDYLEDGIVTGVKGEG